MAPGYSQPPQDRRSPSAFFSDGLVVGDFDRDGNADFAVADNISNTVNVFLGNGTGSFTAATGSPFAVATAALRTGWRKLQWTWRA